MFQFIDSERLVRSFFGSVCYFSSASFASAHIKILWRLFFSKCVVLINQNIKHGISNIMHIPNAKPKRNIKIKTFAKSISNLPVKFIYSEKATKFCEIFTVFDWRYLGQIYGGDFTNFCDLLRIFEL